MTLYENVMVLEALLDPRLEIRKHLLLFLLTLPLLSNAVCFWILLCLFL